MARVLIGILVVLFIGTIIKMVLVRMKSTKGASGNAEPPHDRYPLW